MMVLTLKLFDKMTNAMYLATHSTFTVPSMTLCIAHVLWNTQLGP